MLWYSLCTPEYKNGLVEQPRRLSQAAGEAAVSGGWAPQRCLLHSVVLIGLRQYLL